ncbi:MAG TPA: TonB-dependent receptor [Gammaproteobacteria bacterium]
MEHRPALRRAHRRGQSLRLSRIAFAVRTGVACACVLSAAGVAGLANAQVEPPQPPGAPEEITVTGSRIQRTGMTTPTPVTAVDAGQLAQMAPGNLIDSLNQLPQFFNNASPQTQFNFAGTAGASNLNIRGIGSDRTLVLLDGRRIVSSNRLGTTDINVFPEAMIERVEVVTGGASAAYGSDAVAGVANFILNTDFTGIDTHFQGGLTGEGDAENSEASFTYGTDIGDRAHWIGSVDYYSAAGVDGYEGRDWYQGWGTVTNPEWVASGGAVGPQLIIAPNVVSTEYTFGGMIRAPGTSLDRLMFLPDGSVTPFVQSELSVFDTGTQSQSIAPQFGGGSGDNIEADRGGEGGLVPSIDRGSAYTYFDYDLSSNLNVFVQALYGNNKTNSPAFTSLMFGPWQATLFRDNAFLPETVQELMDEEGLTSVGFSRLASSADLGIARFEQENGTLSGTVGFNALIEGDGFFDGWSIDGYYQYGENRNRVRMFNFPRVDRIFQQMDAVFADDGSIVCRAALFDPARYGDCIPLNLLGEGRASPEAIAYATEGTKVVRADLVQHFVEVVANGELWDDRDAGAVSVAFGASYREDSIDQVVSDITNPTNDPDFDAVPFNDPSRGIQGIPLGYQGVSSGFQFSTSPNIDGRFNVKEIFAETLVPLVTDAAAADELNLSLAARMADYSGSGSVASYKLGLDWQIYDDLRLRGTYSRDVRAATLSERFDRQGQGASAEDPFLGNISYAFGQTIGGNPEVDPEEADTLTVGVVYQPSVAPGLSFSVDWYEIDIAGAIDQLGVQRIVDDCFQGAEELCQLITRSDETLPGEPIGRITNVENLFLNVSAAKVSGVDTEVTYTKEFGQHSIALRGLVSYLDENSITNIGAPTDNEAGDILAGLPRWKATAGVNYSNGPFSVYVQERYIGSGYRNNDDLEGNVTPPPGFTDATISDNTIESTLYTDMRLSYTFTRGGAEWEIYGNVNNVFDEEPPIVAGFFNFFGSTQVNEALYDVLGRRFTAGFTFRY